jgi:protein-L-isoaspartate(D-aspartate) O-methyltransferase
MVHPSQETDPMTGSSEVPSEDWYAEEQERMVNWQIARRGIRDPRVLEAMRNVPRWRFVPPAERSRAYYDGALPIGHGQTISQPYVVAYMTEALSLTGTERVLEIGTGSGYQAAILAELAQEVYSIERVAALSERAKALLAELGYTNLHVRMADGTLGWPEAAPFDAVLVTAAAPTVPEPLKEQLEEGGRLVIPVGPRWSQEVTRVTRRKNRFVEERLMGVMFVPLLGQHGWNERDSPWDTWRDRLGF